MEIYLKDNTYKYIYGNTGKKLFVHEYAIFISDFFITKFRDAYHFYLDNIFIYHPGLKQLLDILCYDKK